MKGLGQKGAGGGRSGAGDEGQDWAYDTVDLEVLMRAERDEQRLAPNWRREISVVGHHGRRRVRLLHLQKRLHAQAVS